MTDIPQDPTLVSVASTILIGAVGAVIGIAAKAYLDHRRLLYKRRLRHSNSLVMLELRLLDVGAALHDNKLKFHHIVRGAKQGQVMIGRPLSLVLEDSFFKDSYVLELNNKLYQFRYDLQRVNSDIENFNRGYEMLGNAIVLKEIEPAYFLENLNGLLAEQDTLRTGFQKLLDSSIQLLGYVRMRKEKDNTWLMRHRSKVLQRGIKEVTDEEVQQKVKEHMASIMNNQRDKS